jgi:hypothetical protein
MFIGYGGSASAVVAYFLLNLPDFQNLDVA